MGASAGIRDSAGRVEGGVQAEGRSEQKSLTIRPSGGGARADRHGAGGPRADDDSGDREAAQAACGRPGEVKMSGVPVSFLLTAVMVSASAAQTPAPDAPAAPSAGQANRISPYHGMKLSDKAKEYYPAAWGVDRLRVNYTSSGNLIRFSYRVLEPKLAKALGDHESTPYLFAPRSNAMLQVPTMEKIGQLRQLGTAEANKEYWMVFSNKGNLVRPGERVNVVIGRFHADGLLVE
ncbi:MAG: hypothetical protein ACYC9Z_13920 [Casimicrobiaceae bacterium]